MQPFYLTPGNITYSLAVCLRQSEKKIQFAPRAISVYDCAANRFAIVYDPVCLTLIYAALYSSAGNDLAFLFKLIIAHAEFLYGSIFECPLIVFDELLSVVFLQWDQFHLCIIHYDTCQTPEQKIPAMLHVHLTGLTRHLI
jgi:hypothetical protein